MMRNKKKSSSIERFIRLTEDFVPHHHGPDHVWIFYLREKRKWVRVHVQKYKRVYYLTTSDSVQVTFPDSGYVEPAELRRRLKIWTQELSQWKKSLLRDPIAAQATLYKNLPLSLRWGVMQRRNVKTLLPNWLPIEMELTAKEKHVLLSLLDKPDPDPQPDMTLDRFLDYCRIAYQANATKLSGFRSGLSGREYYQKYADGRDGGLLKIAVDSPEEFERWYDSKERQGCHPWEIYRGGNSTHIDLAVVRSERGGWSIYLDAFSSTRLVETCRIVLALNKASLPFKFGHKESYKLRLLAEDWVGVVPEGSDLSYAWHQFPREWNVADAIHISWIFEENPEKRRALRIQLRQLVYWLPEQITNG